MSSPPPAPSPQQLRALRHSPVPLLASLAGSTASTRSFSVIASELSHSLSNEWKGRTVLITGAASGIGAAVACEAGSRGANVVLGDLASQEQQVEKVVADIKASGGQATYRSVDVTSWPQQLALFRDALDMFGKIDVVFANAGIAYDSFDIVKSEPETDKRPAMDILRVNLEGAAYSAHLAHHFLSKNPNINGKALVFTGSLAGFMGGNPPLYYASKHGVLSLARSVAPTVYIAPSNVRTPIFPADWVEAFEQAGVELLNVQDVARAMLWAASKDGGSKRGEAVMLDVSGVRTVSLNMLEWEGAAKAVRARL
ncbi:hypothetical protein JCM10207_004014 [Rhodosporidiobolus poonsookiae]